MKLIQRNGGAAVAPQTASTAMSQLGVYALCAASFGEMLHRFLMPRAAAASTLAHRQQNDAQRADTVVDDRC
tara:strand:- start:252 stop:467 length:216 start_codon:yes stop_codon:yes gene_type:complete